jgi:DNA-binding PadR family transcriptional regulator
MFHVLVALCDGDQHGYAIMKAVARHTSDRVVLSTGTLYGIIKRLLAEGLIVESARRPAAALDDERRRYYRLTDFGRRVAIAEAERLEAMVAVVRAPGLLEEPGTA